MLHLLDDSLDAFLRATGPLPASDVDVSFEPPDGDWSAGLSRPAVNLYLWRLRRSVAEASAGTEMVEQNGMRFRRGPRPRVELGYLITTWAAEARNAHQLLGRVLIAFLGTNELPVEYLQGPLADVRPVPSLSLSKADDDPPSEFWVALGGRFQPGRRAHRHRHHRSRDPGRGGATADRGRDRRDRPDGARPHLPAATGDRPGRRADGLGRARRPIVRSPRGAWPSSTPREAS